MFPPRDTKRKANREAETPGKRKKGAHNPPEVARSVARATKRKASREAEMPSKRKRGAHNPPEVARSIARAPKRKASREAETPCKRKRGAHNPPEVARSIARATKKKANREEETPIKRKRGAHNPPEAETPTKRKRGAHNPPKVARSVARAKQGKANRETEKPIKQKRGAHNPPEAETPIKRKRGAHNPPEVARSVARAKQRKASREAETPCKRKKGAHNPPEVAGSVARATKRKASKEAETPSKRKRGAHNPPEVAGSVARATKRKASKESKTPSKRKRGENSETDPSPISRGQSSISGSIFSFLVGHYSSSDFNDKYQKLQEVGEGGFGSVYAGLRKSDSLPVAIKCIPKDNVKFVPFVFEGQEHKIPFEVLIMVGAGGPAGFVGKSAVVQLLDWYDLGEQVFLVMERPVPCVDLVDYVEDNCGQLDEHKAKIIMKQLVEAAIDMHAMKTFHRDLKLENILIQTTSDGPRVRIIDFGCGCYAQDGPYHSFSGTSVYAPPEFFSTNSYEAVPTTVWQLGAVLFELLDGSVEFDTRAFIRSEVKISKELSQECQDLLNMCLAPHSDKRATLEQIREHPWLSCSCVNCDK
ncbi:aurora kinase B-like isoform X3 [Paralichthys olivaceus]|uniref:aurora kinase B-like isoform X3 n=1 Tax=Paralichthys olivaceus TaxID=8255 RepID=UPI00375205E1